MVILGAGGTYKITNCTLANVNNIYANHQNPSLIITDGWDRGDPELLRAEIGRLQRNCYRLIWLNPLLGSPGYRPESQGLAVALPHVDDFAPLHDLASLRKLGRLLAH